MASVSSQFWSFNSHDLSKSGRGAGGGRGGALGPGAECLAYILYLE